MIPQHPYKFQFNSFALFLHCIDDFRKPDHTEDIIVLLCDTEIHTIITGRCERWQTGRIQFEVVQMVIAFFGWTLKNKRTMFGHRVDEHFQEWFTIGLLQKIAHVEASSFQQRLIVGRRQSFRNSIVYL